MECLANQLVQSYKPDISKFDTFYSKLSLLHAGRFLPGRSCSQINMYIYICLCIFIYSYFIYYLIFSEDTSHEFS